MKETKFDTTTNYNIWRHINFSITQTCFKYLLTLLNELQAYLHESWCVGLRFYWTIITRLHSSGLCSEGLKTPTLQQHYKDQHNSYSVNYIKHSCTELKKIYI